LRDAAALPMSNFVRSPGPVSPGLRIGLLGGSFNPAHEGHLYVSEVARKRLGLDFVWWLVSPQNPLKPAKDTASMAVRLSRARSVANNPRIVLTDIEQDMGTRYTIDTVTALQRRFPQVRFLWIMGSDNLDSFHRWRRWPDIVRRVPIAVVARPGSAISAIHTAPMMRFAHARRSPHALADSHPPAIAFLDGPRNWQSSTAIRNAARRR
jgi:nicotinate-nucleotide adenylyltransferase